MYVWHQVGTGNSCRSMGTDLLVSLKRDPIIRIAGALVKRMPILINTGLSSRQIVFKRGFDEPALRSDLRVVPEKCLHLLSDLSAQINNASITYPCRFFALCGHEAPRQTLAPGENSSNNDVQNCVLHGHMMCTLRDWYVLWRDVNISPPQN